MATDMKPPAAAAEFLQQNGWNDSRISPVAGDASFRRYFRVEAGGRKAILMDAPPPHEDPKPFIAIAEYLTGSGFAAPEIFARDLTEGLVLLEDFGDQRKTKSRSIVRSSICCRHCTGYRLRNCPLMTSSNICAK